MLFKKNSLINQKDMVADTYMETLKEQREKVKAKTREIQKCIQDGLSCPIEKKEEAHGDEEVL